MRLLKELSNPVYHNEVMMNLLAKSKIPSDNYDFRKTIDKIYNCNYKWSPPKRTLIPKSDGKSYREIFIFNEEDSILQKIINEVLAKNKMNLISDSVYSYRKGISISDIAKVVQKNKKNLVFAKVDISNYFLSVKKDVIDNAINDIFFGDLKAKKLIKDLFNLHGYINSKTGDYVDKYLSLMPGSAISAYFANYVLSKVDLRMADECKFFSRYSDDMLIGCDSMIELNEKIELLSGLLDEIGLEIKPSKTVYFDKEDSIDFLGLEIKEDDILLSKSNIQNIKKLVKHVCKQERKYCEINKGNPIDYVKYAIYKLNNKFYKSIFDESQTHKGNRASFIFNCVTNEDCIKELDYYIKGRLNYVFSGKNNSKVYLQQYELESLGYISLNYMRTLYKADRDVYLHRCWECNKSIGAVTKYLPSPQLQEYTITQSIDINSWHSLLKYLADNRVCILYNNKIYNSSFIEISYIAKYVRINDFYLVKDGYICVNYLDIVHTNKTGIRLKLNFKDLHIAKANVNTTIMLYLDYCCADKDYEPIKYNYTRKIKQLDLINLIKEEFLHFDVNAYSAGLYFFSYLLQLNLYNEWYYAGFKDSCGYKKYSDKLLSIVLPIA